MVGDLKMYSDMRKIYPLPESLVGDITSQIEELRDRQEYIRMNKPSFYNWELTFNRIDLIIDKLYEQREVAKILES